MNLRSYLTNIVTGDQVIFVKKEAFLKAGCFPEQLLMEDIELSKKLCRLSRPSCINYPRHNFGSSLGAIWSLENHLSYVETSLGLLARCIQANQLAEKYQ